MDNLKVLFWPLEAVANLIKVIGLEEFRRVRFLPVAAIVGLHMTLVKEQGHFVVLFGLFSDELSACVRTSWFDCLNYQT